MSPGVIFDMDGVLVASGPAHRESWRVLARQQGITLSDEAFAETFGMPSRDIIRLIWGVHVTDDEIRRIDEEKEAVYRGLVTGRVPLSPGAHEMLGRLAGAGYAPAIATSGPPENVELVLNQANLRPYFAATVNGFDVARGKPAPDIFLAAAAKAKLRAGDCVVVEDAPVGIQAGRAAGMPVIGYVGTHPADRLRAAGAARVTEHLAEITPELVGQVLTTPCVARRTSSGV